MRLSGSETKLEAKGTKSSDMSIDELREAGEACGLTEDQVDAIVSKKSNGLIYNPLLGLFVKKEDDGYYVPSIGGRLKYLDKVIPERLENLQESYRLTRLPANRKSKFAKLGSPADCGHDLTTKGTGEAGFAPGNKCKVGSGQSQTDDLEPGSKEEVQAGELKLKEGKDYILKDKSKYKQECKQMFGEVLNPAKILQLAAYEEIKKAVPKFKPEIHVAHNYISIQYDDGDFEINRYVYKKSNGELAIKNEMFFPPKHMIGQGDFSIKVFTSQVASAIKAGISRIDTDAVGKYGGSMNGYYTWPRFGYDAVLPDKHYDNDLKQARIESLIGRKITSDGPPVKLSDLMKTPDGREYWKMKGSSINCVFGLKEGSLSRRVLSLYLKERRLDDPGGPNRFRLSDSVTRFYRRIIDGKGKRKPASSLEERREGSRSSVGSNQEGGRGEEVEGEKEELEKYKKYFNHLMDGESDLSDKIMKKIKSDNLFASKMKDFFTRIKMNPREYRRLVESKDRETDFFYIDGEIERAMASHEESSSGPDRDAESREATNFLDFFKAASSEAKRSILETVSGLPEDRKSSIMREVENLHSNRHKDKDLNELWWHLGGGSDEGTHLSEIIKAARST